MKNESVFIVQCDVRSSNSFKELPRKTILGTAGCCEGRITYHKQAVL